MRKPHFTVSANVITVTGVALSQSIATRKRQAYATPRRLHHVGSPGEILLGTPCRRRSLAARRLSLSVGQGGKPFSPNGPRTTATKRETRGKHRHFGTSTQNSLSELALLTTSSCCRVDDDVHHTSEPLEYQSYHTRKQAPCFLKPDTNTRMITSEHLHESLMD